MSVIPMRSDERDDDTPARASIPGSVREGPVCGWGRVCADGRERFSEQLEPASSAAALSRGLGRSYGDSSLPSAPAREVLNTRLADRILAFDPDTRVLRAEAGLSLYALHRVMLRRGFFPPSTPGTQYVTLGGMVASDVHGKGHHVDGCFGSGHVRALRIRVPDGRVLECSREQHSDLFRATIGGMGLTGHILEVEFTMQAIPSPWITSETRRIDSIDEFVETIKETSEKWPYQVGWLDTFATGEAMGRGILDYGRWATAEEAGGKPLPYTRRLTVPFTFPEWVVSRPPMRAFSTLYYHQHVRKVRKQRLRHPDSFFYPLDTFLEWNRGYGRRGFTQYQCVLPSEAGLGAVRRFLELLTGRGGASFVSVIKDCGGQGIGVLSFPRAGITIALDLALRDDTQALVDALNERVIAEGGRVYLTKDLLTRPEHFRAMEPRLDEWLAIRDRWDPERKLRSAQSVRLFGDAP